jgi:hypothetical protein
MGRFFEIGVFIGILSLVLKDELPQSMTNCLERKSKKIQSLEVQSLYVVNDIK